jgi:hypothetical protein
MKKIDIHTGRETEDDNRYKRSIESDQVYQYVLSQIDFPLPESHWNVIDHAFAEMWNHKIGIGGYSYWDEFCDYVYQEVKKTKLLISRERIDLIVNHILTYIENNGGFLS